MKRIKELVVFVMLFLPALTFAQNGIIRGFIYEKENGEPMMFTNVYLKGTTIGSSTDVNGFFNISKVPPGNYTLMVTTIGYDSIKIDLKVTAGGILTQKLQMNKASIALKEFVVSADRQDAVAEVRTSVVKVTPKQIKQMPTVGGEPDFAQYVQVLPGVIFTGDQGGQLYIRGGSPIQNKVLLDGMTVYNPFHSIGLFSVFDADIIRNADVFTGGFNADYGGRVSSIMDITMKDGNKKRFAGKLSTSTFGSKIMLEGPIKKLSDNGTSASFIFSGKTSYLEQSSKYLYTYIDTGGLPFNFTDLYGKVSLNADNGTKVSLFGFNFTDQVRYRAISNLNWQSAGIGANIILVPAGSNVLVKSNFSYSQYDITLVEKDGLPRNSFIGGFNFGLSFLYFLGKDELNYGIEGLGFKTKFVFYNSIGRKIAPDPNNTSEMSGFIKYKHSFGKLLFEPGFRLQYYASLSKASPEPRLGMKYIVTDKWRIKLASGMYSQNFISANSDRDVVNLFSGFLSGPETGYMPAEFKGEPVKHALQTATHFILGTEYDLTQRININVEGYYKINTQITNINRNKLYEDVPENADKDDYLKKDFVVETGNAYGIDFVLKYDYKRIYLWCVYSLGYVDRDDGILVYNPHYDRRHNVNLVGNYTFGKSLNWEFNVRWNLGSGFPFTQTQGYYELLPFNNGISTNYTNANGQVGIIYGDLDKGRLPYYHRLDVSLKHAFDVGKNAQLEATVGVTNVYNRANIFYFDRVKQERVNQLPFMPSAGINFTF